MTDHHAGGHKRLLVARHAKSSWDDPSTADHDRPLAPRGQRAAERLRQHLQRVAPPPDLVLCSTSRRTRETLDGIRPWLGVDTEIAIEATLYGADAELLLSRLQRIDDRVGCALLIGHNPGVAELTELLVDPGRGREAFQGKFPTAAVASLSFPGRWDELEPAAASLDSFWKPRGASS